MSVLAGVVRQWPTVLLRDQFLLRLLQGHQTELSKKARVAIGTIRRMESFDGPIGSRTDTLRSVTGHWRRPGLNFWITVVPKCG
jgi:hypothetical protein